MAKYIGPTVPTTANFGDDWFDTTNNVVRVFQGGIINNIDNWKTEANGAVNILYGSAAAKPVNAPTGTIYITI
jgi:hypothetical protein